MINKIQLSIIVPMYNAENFIEECIESILSEAKNDIEVLLVNDGSTDNTAKKCEKYIINHSINYYYKNNNGVSSARNFGLKKAKGKYIMFVDADDLLEKGWYSIISKYFESDSQEIFISKNIDSKLKSKKNIVENILGINNQCNFSSSCSKLYKKEIIDKWNIKFREDIINGEDLLFNLQYFKKIENYDLVKYTFYKYKINYDSATHKYNNNYIESSKTLVEQVEKELLDYKNEFKAFYLKNLYNSLNRINEIVNYNDRLSELKKLTIDNKLKISFKCIKYKFNYFEKIVLYLYKLKLYSLMNTIISIKKMILKYKKSKNNIYFNYI